MEIYVRYMIYEIYDIYTDMRYMSKYVKFLVLGHNVLIDMSQLLAQRR